MKKRILLITLFVAQINFAQNIFPANGNVGIGTTTPASTLEINTTNVGSQFSLLNSGLNLSNVSIGVGKAIGNGNSGFLGWQNTGTNTGFLFLESFSSSMPVVLNQLGGYVGIGTSSPIAKLHVNGDISTSVNGSIGFNTPDAFSAYGGSRPHYGLGYSVNGYPLTLSGYFGLGLFTAGYERLKIDIAGNIGIGTTSPIAKLHVDGDISTSVNGSIGFNTPDVFSAYGGSRPHYGLGYSVNGYPLTLSGYFGLGLFTAGYERLKIDTAGNIGIGTTTPDAKLAVNGTIHSKEVKVDINGWSDFVFKKEYNLPTLEEVEKHINEKGHLANIPSEAEVLKNGINLGEMNAKLLQKIEELTLYVIEQNRVISSLKKEKQNTEILALKLEKMQLEINSLKKN